jgi:hypothetical protein
METGASRVVAAGAALAAALLCTPVLSADSSMRLDERWHSHPLRDRIFFFAGGDIASDSAFGWSGFTAAPIGFLEEDGWRLRVAGGGGRYRYRTDNVAGGVNEANVMSGELMAGYRFSSGSGSVTLYAGAHIENQILAAPDAGHAAQGTEAGIKVAAEFYRRFTPNLFGLASASVSSVHDSYQARAALAYEISETVAFGVEAAINGDERYDEPRAGVLVQTTFGRTSLSLSGGILSNSDKGDGLYGTLSVYAVY